MPEINVADLVAKLRLDNAEFVRNVAQADQAAKQFLDDFSQRAGEMATGLLEAGRGVQRLTREMRGLGQGEQAALRLTESIRSFRLEFAQAFEEQDITQTVKRLNAFGLAGQQLDKDLRRIANVAAATGKSLEDFADPFGEFLNTRAPDLGVIEELRGNFNIGAKELAAYGAEVRQVGADFELLGDTAEQVEKAQAALRALIDARFPAAAREITSEADRMRESFRQLGEDAGTALADLEGRAAQFLGPLAEELNKLPEGLKGFGALALSSSAGLASLASQGLLAAANLSQLGVTLAGVRTAMLALALSPVGIAAGLATLVAAIGAAVIEFQRAKTAAAEAELAFGERMAGAMRSTSQEAEALRTVMEELGDVSGKTAEEIRAAFAATGRSAVETVDTLAERRTKLREEASQLEAELAAERQAQTRAERDIGADDVTRDKQGAREELGRSLERQIFLKEAIALRERELEQVNAMLPALREVSDAENKRVAEQAAATEAKQKQAEELLRKLEEDRAADAFDTAAEELKAVEAVLEGLSKQNDAYKGLVADRRRLTKQAAEEEKNDREKAAQEALDAELRALDIRDAREGLSNQQRLEALREIVARHKEAAAARGGFELELAQLEASIAEERTRKAKEESDKRKALLEQERRALQAESQQGISLDIAAIDEQLAELEQKRGESAANVEAQIRALIEERLALQIRAIEEQKKADLEGVKSAELRAAIEVNARKEVAAATRAANREIEDAAKAQVEASKKVQDELKKEADARTKTGDAAKAAQQASAQPAAPQRQQDPDNNPFTLSLEQLGQQLSTFTATAEKGFRARPEFGRSEQERADEAAARRAAFEAANPKAVARVAAEEAFRERLKTGGGTDPLTVEGRAARLAAFEQRFNDLQKLVVDPGFKPGDSARVFQGGVSAPLRPGDPRPPVRPDGLPTQGQREAAQTDQIRQAVNQTFNNVFNVETGLQPADVNKVADQVCRKLASQMQQARRLAGPAAPPTGRA